MHLARRENEGHLETLVLQAQLVAVGLGVCLVLWVISDLLDRSERREPPDHPGLLGWRDLLVRLGLRDRPVPPDPRASLVRRVRPDLRVPPVSEVSEDNEDHGDDQDSEGQQDRKVRTGRPGRLARRASLGWSVHQDPWDPPVPPDQPAHQDSASSRSASISDNQLTTTESLPSVQPTEGEEHARGSFHEEGHDA